MGQGGLPGVDLRSAPLDARTKLALQAAVALMAAGGGVFGAPARAPRPAPARRTVALLLVLRWPGWQVLGDWVHRAGHGPRQGLG